MNITALNAEFGIDDQLEFMRGKGGFVHARVTNALGRATVSTYGGQVLGYRPAGRAEDLLFVSGKAHYAEGKAIKGGVPVCWPWFGADPAGAGRPAHGFVRNRQWRVIGSGTLDDGPTRLVLGVDSDAATRRIWDHEFALRIEISVGSRLEIALTTRNSGAHAMQLTQALHAYFRVGDSAAARVSGLESHRYIDKLDGGRGRIQEGPVVIAAEVDRIYTDVDGELSIEDPVLQRRIRIGSTGSRSAVVWNPWIEGAASMADLGDDDYRGMLCVETANAGADVVSIAPGEAFRLVARYGVESD